ncbi:MAG: sulfurtransferase TusA family protein [Pseudorhodobacter sp.]
MEWDEELDAQGLLCPLPVLKARKRLKGLGSGAVLRVLATDPAAVIDIPHFCAESGNLLVGSGEIGAGAFGAAQYYLIRKT